MIQAIFNWLVEGLGSLLELLIKAVLGVLDLDINIWITAFPFLGTAYQIFQGVAIGMIVIMAALAMLKFFQPAAFGGEQSNDRPFGIMAYTLIATMAVFMGNHVLSIIINIAKIPYDIFASINVNAAGFDGIGDNLKNYVSDTVFELLGTNISIALVLCETFILALIIYNLMKLVLEVFERFMMVGILTYLSPLAFAFLVSSSGRSVFKRWVSMFVGGCALMAISAFFFDLVISGLSYMTVEVNGDASGLMSGGHLQGIVRLLLILAVCKIAQRADSYMQQLGIGVATTGGGMFEDIYMAGKAMGNMFKSANGQTGGNKASVLDGSKLPGAGYNSRMAENKPGANSGIAAVQPTGSIKAAGTAIHQGLKQSSAAYAGVSAGIAAAKSAKSQNESAATAAKMTAKAAVGATAGTVGRNLANTFMPKTMANINAAKEQSAEAAVRGAEEAASKRFDNSQASRAAADASRREYQSLGTAPLSDDIAKKVAGGQTLTPEERQDVRNNVSPIDNNGSAWVGKPTDTDDAQLGPAALAHGIKLTDGTGEYSEDNKRLAGDAQTIAAVCAGTVSAGYTGDELRVAANTAHYDASVADALLNNPNISTVPTSDAQHAVFGSAMQNLHGNDFGGEIIRDPGAAKIREDTGEPYYDDNMVPSVRDVAVIQMPDRVDEDGNIYSGGTIHAGEAFVAVTDNEGNTVFNRNRLSVANEAAYEYMPDEEKEAWTRSANKTGQVQYTKIETVATFKERSEVDACFSKSAGSHTFKTKEEYEISVNDGEYKFGSTKDPIILEKGAVRITQSGYSRSANSGYKRSGTRSSAKSMGTQKTLKRGGRTNNNQ